MKKIVCLCVVDIITAIVTECIENDHKSIELSRIHNVNVKFRMIKYF